MTQKLEDELVSVSKTNYSAFSQGFAKNYALPLLPLPPEWKNLGVRSTKIGKTLVPKADPVLSEYEKKYAQIVYTQKFVKFVEDNQAAAKIKNAEMRKVLAKYLPNAFQSSAGFGIFRSPDDFSSRFLFPAYGLNSQLTALKNEYVKKLSVVSYPALNKSIQLGDENARQLVEIVEGYANEEIEKFFGNLSFSSYKTVESVIQNAENAYNDSPAAADNKFCGVNPVTGTPGINAVASGVLGELRPGIGGDGRFKRRSDGIHDGIDIRAPVGTPLYANKDGVVAQLTTTGGFGNRLILEHKGKVYTHYAHLQSFASGIAATVEVTEGQLIGYAGRTGNVPRTQLASEDHVHFGVSVDLVRPTSQSPAWKNPVMYLNECVLSTERG